MGRSLFDAYMAYWYYILAGVIVLLCATGRWRLVFLPFAIPRRKMTVERLGLHVAGADQVARVDTILNHFAGGFNAMITRPRLSAAFDYCEHCPPHFRPFAEEGVAMGAEFEKLIVRPRPGFRYLYYVGLGFWAGMRSYAPGRLERMVDGLDPLHGHLCYDGYGFKVAFFDHPKDAAALDRLRGFRGYARNAAFHGVGRAQWFRFIGEPLRLVEEIRRTGEFAADVAAGVGLAAVFVNPDRLDLAQDMGRRMPPEWHEHFHLGMCFALKARSINHLEQFNLDLARQPKDVQQAAWASIRECDRVELLVRSDAAEDKYRRWREAVTAWMAEEIEYPMAGVRPATAGKPRGVVSRAATRS
ncbi:MAG: DUF1702 family protein [Planctomycetes bacterium]|nr:DUF1702 family protein [Planctomycetota bacterium]